MRSNQELRKAGRESDEFSGLGGKLLQNVVLLHLFS
jgi:hypothetical protein